MSLPLTLFRKVQISAVLEISLRPPPASAHHNHTKMQIVIRTLIVVLLAIIAAPRAAVAGTNTVTKANGHQAASHETVRVAVTNSWLESCVKDLLGRHESVETVRLAPPGSCPGHFDMKPGDLARVEACVALLRFDFQAPIEEHFARGGAGAPPVIVVPGPKGLCVPENYLAACETVAEQLRAVLPEIGADSWDRALANLRERMDRLSRQTRDELERMGLAGAPVIASAHQAVFCRWLGLDVVATFSAADTASPAPLEALVARGREAGVRFVIGNLQEGTQAGEALAHHLGAKLAVFSNFPPMTPDKQFFDQLVQDNLFALERAAGLRP
jgi:zinc transport system substrate-binding protein